MRRSFSILFAFLAVFLAESAMGAPVALPTPAPLPVAAREAFRKQQSAAHVLADPDHFIWCLTAMRWTDGRIHAYYSRWPKKQGFGAWMTDCEIMHAVADSPGGPFTTTGVVLASRKPDGWDAISSHNPMVCVADGKIHLYYISNDLRKTQPEGPPGEDWLKANRDTIRNSQRVGLATAPRPEGPFVRTPEPVVVPHGSFKNVAVNPAVVFHDGAFRMIVKGDDMRREGVFRVQFAGESANAAGPFTFREKPVFSEAQSEDACLWFDRTENQFHSVLHLMGQSVLAHLVSPNGLDWRKAESFTFMRKEFTLADGSIWKPKRVERPFVLTDAMGRPEWIYLAVADQGISGNVAVRLENR